MLLRLCHASKLTTQGQSLFAFLLYILLLAPHLSSYPPYFFPLNIGISLDCICTPFLFSITGSSSGRICLTFSPCASKITLTKRFSRAFVAVRWARSHGPVFSSMSVGSPSAF